jgi:hypothetical protein
MWESGWTALAPPWYWHRLGTGPINNDKNSVQAFGLSVSYFISFRHNRGPAERPAP